MSVKITTLIENLAYGDKLMGEHGLSLLIETDDGSILFDTGQSGKFIDNARVLGVDLSKIRAVALSHGHYDHTGGLEAFCAVNDSAKIYAKRGLFVPKYKKAGSTEQKFIGTPYLPRIYQNRIHWVDRPTEILPNLVLIPETPLVNDWDTHFGSMFVQTESGFEPDVFDDEQFLIVRRPESIDVVSGCSHRGITNIAAAASMFAQKPIRLVLGGFHTKDAESQAVEALISDLSRRGVEKLGVCHCTGVEKYPEIKRIFGGNAFYSYTGLSM